jgi:ankyrin repeat protein
MIRAAQSTIRKSGMRLMTLLFLALIATASFYLRSLGKRDDALIGAVLKGSLIAAERLLHQGANPNRQIAFDAKDRPYAWSPLAAMGSGTSPGGPQSRPTPLIVAARQGDDRMVRLLLANGAHINAKAHYSQQTALLAAIEGRHATTTELLLQNHAAVNTDIINGIGDLNWAVQCGDASVLKVVLKYESDSISQPYHGMTPLSMAKRAGNSAMVRMLEDTIRLHTLNGGD